MKIIKNLLYTLVIALVMAIPLKVYAASCNIKVSSGSTAVVGSTITVKVTLSSSSAMGSWEYLLNYNSSYLKLVSGNTSVADYTTSANGTKNKTYTLKFQALKSGATSINIGSYLVYAFDESQMNVSVSNQTIKIITQEELEASYSKDNNLKNLEVEGYTLTPEFNKDTTEYKLTVPSDVTNINIIATKNDAEATVSGDGEKEVVEGTNVFDIVVKAQNGTEKTYKLTVEVEDLNPITIKIGGKDYTIVKREDILTKPSSYEKTTLKINDIEVPAFVSETTGFTLVGVKDEDGKISLAIYDEKNNTYTLYNEFTSNNLILYLTNFPDELKGYKKNNISINDVNVEVYQYKDDSRFVICYGMNVETGKYDYYSYDTKENTFQIWNDEEIKDLKKKEKIYFYMCISFGAGLIIAILLIIYVLSKKKKKNIKKEVKKDKKKTIINEDDLL